MLLESLGPILLGLIFLVSIGFLALLVFRVRSGKTKEAASNPQVQTSPGLARKASVPPASRVDGGDDDEITNRTLAVSGTRPSLIAAEGPAGSRKTYYLSASGLTTVGRAIGNDIVLPERAASARHCRIEKQAQSYVLTDLGSTNQTWINGVAREQAVLRNGDKIQIGATTLIFASFGNQG